MTRYRSQPRLKGIIRVPRGTSVVPAMEKWIATEAKLFGVSKSFVLANCISFASGIPMESYREPRKLTGRMPKVYQFKRRA